MTKRFFALLLVFLHILTQSAFAFEFNPVVIQPVLIPAPVFSLREGYQLPQAKLREEVGTFADVNQYTTIGSTTLNHDGNGNTTFDGINTFTYDEENRMVTASNSQMSAIYTFDALDRRVGKLVTPTGGVSVPSAYLYSGDQIIEQVDPTGAFQSIFIYGNGLDEPISMFYGNLYAYHQDGLGSIDAVLDWNGNVAEYNLYDVFGQPSILASPINNLFMFTGRQWDPETGTFQYRASQYSPLLGRFLQRDPIGYYDSMNLFSYTINNPVNYVDPTGETIWDVVDVGFFLDSLDKFARCSSLENAETLALDTISLLPIIPSLGYITRIDDSYKTLSNIKTKGLTVIGHMPEYIEKAKALGANYLKPLKDWNWQKQGEFIKNVIKRGDDVLIGTPIREGASVLKKEIKQLIKAGYRPVEQGSNLLRKF